MPRLKNLKKQRLHRPHKGEPDKYANLQPILARPVNWEIIEQQYNEFIKFATALRLGTADAESILRRFTKNNVQHPTYKAVCELGKALKTVFLCDYLRLESLRREIHEDLEVIENWNSANDFILYGKVGSSPPTGWRSRDSHAAAASAASEPGVREHAHDSVGVGRTGMARPADGVRPPGTVAAEHAGTDSAGEGCGGYFAEISAFARLRPSNGTTPRPPVESQRLPRRRPRPKLPRRAAHGASILRGRHDNPNKKAIRPQSLADR